MLKIQKTDSTSLPRSNVFAWTMIVGGIQVALANIAFGLVAGWDSTVLYVSWTIPPISFAIALWTFRTGAHLWPCRTLFAIGCAYFTYMAASAGGVDGYYAPLFVVMPIFASFFMGIRSALVCSGILVAILTGLFVFDVLGLLADQPFNESTSRGIAFLTVLTATLFSVLATIAYSWRLSNHARILVEERKRADGANIAKSQFLANMSHEIRTPMNGIMGMAELMKTTELDARQTDFVNIINRSGTALLTIINDILDFSKIEAGHLELDNQPFLLRDSIEDVTTLLASKVTDSGIDMLIRIQPDLPNTFVGDVGRIRQILTNIVGNAVKFTHQGHILIDVSGEVTDDIANLVIKIADTGIGIPEEKLSHIFDKFSQADGSTTRQYGGTGLGLTISRNLVELMGGEITVDSNVGEGSTFTARLDLPVHEDVETIKLAHLNIAGSKILVVDDNAVNREILKEQLSYWKCYCIPATSAKTGLIVLNKAKEKNLKLDLIIVDYQMPGENGEEFVRTIKSNPDFSHLPIIMLSSVDRSELRQRMKELKISAFMTKPARGSVLHNKIGDVLFGESVQPERSHGLPKPTREQRIPISNSGPVDVLIAEDNDVNQTYAKYVMEELGLSYKIVPNGRIAVDKWKLLSPKVVLMDISMPEMNGYEATAKIRELEASENLPRTPIIAVTAHAMKQDKNLCLEHDMDDYLPKPLSINILREKLISFGVAPEQLNTPINAE